MSVVVKTHLDDAVSVWCPTFPRRVGKFQSTAESPETVAAAVGNLTDAPGYVSVYSFPEGHPQENAIPRIDTLFIDMDVPQTGRYGRPKCPEDADREAWLADMDELLKVSRGVARYLVEQGVSKYWRASLSGHKGVHLFLDFPSINRTMGTKEKYKMGLSEFSRSLVQTLGQKTGLSIHKWVDVDSSDLARLTRLPNTLHEGATRNFGEPRYCVPVSLGELSYIDAEAYERLTQSMRAVPDACRRVESVPTAERLTQYIALTRDVRVSKTSTAKSSSLEVPELLESFDSNKNISLKYFLSNLNFSHRCMLRFRENPDAWKYSNQSHYMEFAIMAKAAHMGVPSSVLCEFFSSMPDYDEHWTKYQYAQIINRGYKTPHHKTMWEKCPEFMSPETCSVCAQTTPRTTAF